MRPINGPPLGRSFWAATGQRWSSGACLSQPTTFSITQASVTLLAADRVPQNCQASRPASHSLPQTKRSAGVPRSPRGDRRRNWKQDTSELTSGHRGPTTEPRKRSPISGVGPSPTGEQALVCFTRRCAPATPPLPRRRSDLGNALDGMAQLGWSMLLLGVGTGDAVEGSGASSASQR